MTKILESLSKYINDLAAEVEDAETKRGIQTLAVEICNFRQNRVHMDYKSWVAVGGFDRDYGIKAQSDSDDDKPVESRLFELWFMYDGVKYFCLMLGEEVESYGHTLPV